MQPLTMPSSDHLLRSRPRCSCSGNMQPSRGLHSTFYGRHAAIARPHSRGMPTQRQLSLQVTNAITRKRKEETVAYLTETLEKSIVMFGVRYKKISDKAMTEFRRSLPPDAKIIVAKNSLMLRAANQVEGWSDIKEAAKLENAWVFSGEDGVADTVKAYIEFEKKLLQPFPKEQRLTAKPTDISGGVLQGEFLDYAMVKKLKDMPSRQQLMTTLARLIKKVPTKLAISIKLVPTKLAVGVKKLSEADENKELKVGDVLPKADSAASG